ncbi:FUSC family protein [Kocuria sediminis]|uniref:FUSC family protein n=1 Tax=Kocuria sediminis TaxID=1038857 RepID=A0A6N8GT60_9MICC|nr:FUSC family protein [Kocuria sediminis]MUN64014.1 FUSC family protein [Kocuria sediminis]
MQPGDRARAAARAVGSRTRVGLTRVRTGLLQSFQITVASVGAYVIAERLLGHSGPIFAATAALVALGFAKDGLRYRRVLEVSIGCTLGIAVGDTLIHVLGAGVWQAAVVLMTSILLARFLDNGTLFTTQMGLQSVLVVLLPPSQDGVFARSTDAIVGGACALALAYFVPTDPRRQPRHDLRALVDEFSGVLREAGRAVEDYDATAAWHALVRSRQTQPLVDSVNSGLKSAVEIATASPLYRGRRAEIETIGRSIRFLDLAVRNARVLTRRLASVLNHVTLSDEAVAALTDALDDLADAVTTLGNALAVAAPGSRESYLRQARNELANVAGRLHPREMGVRTMEGETLVLDMRPMVVDLLEAAGMTHEEARAQLPRLEGWDRA